MSGMRDAAIERNMAALKGNAYPGRGIVLGMTPDGKHLVQVYWIMGRSENSRNRVFEMESNGFVRTEAFDESKVKDPSLIIYYPAKALGKTHVVTNGDQTDTIHEALQKGGSFEGALRTRTFEPDGPNFTPRISGMTDLSGAGPAYRLSILKTIGGDPACTVRQFFEYEKGIPGMGHCITTYVRDGDPLPSFEGEPYLVGLFDDLEETARIYWSLLNAENRISLLVKFLDAETGESRVRILNKHLGD
jgi:hypothetical protein